MDPPTRLYTWTKPSCARRRTKEMKESRKRSGPCIHVDGNKRISVFCPREGASCRFHCTLLGPSWILHSLSRRLAGFVLDPYAKYAQVHPDPCVLGLVAPNGYIIFLSLSESCSVLNYTAVYNCPCRRERNIICLLIRNHRGICDR